MQELDELLKGDEVKEEPAPVDASTTTDEFSKKQEQLDNLNRAIEEANAKLRELRETKKVVKEEVEIDFEDPASKAWAKHIQDNVDPVKQELEKEKEEIRTFALKEFLNDKPNLASNPEKLKEMMSVYEKIKTASERTREGVLNDLHKAFAVVYHEELINSAREQRTGKAVADVLFSEPLVSRGATSYFQEKTPSPEKDLTDEDKAILAKWGMTPQEWAETKKNNS